MQAEVEPLRKIRRRVFADTQLNIMRVIHADNFNGSGIELGGNVKSGHGWVANYGMYDLWNVRERLRLWRHFDRLRERYPDASRGSSA